MSKMVGTVTCQIFKYHENDLSVLLVFLASHCELPWARVVFWKVNICRYLNSKL